MKGPRNPDVRISKIDRIDISFAIRPTTTAVLMSPLLRLLRVFCRPSVYCKEATKGKKKSESTTRGARAMRVDDIRQELNACLSGPLAAEKNPPIQWIDIDLSGEGYSQVPKEDIKRMVNELDSFLITGIPETFAERNTTQKSLAESSRPPPSLDMRFDSHSPRRMAGAERGFELAFAARPEGPHRLTFVGHSTRSQLG